MVTPAGGRPSQGGGKKATLIVEFTGLCLYAPDKETINGVPRSVAVYMPDCRRMFVNDMHTDGTRGEPHAGYLSIPLQNLGIPVVPRNLDPTNPNSESGMPEAVYQFDRQQLTVPGVSSPMAKVDIGVPGFAKVAPGSSARSDLMNDPAKGNDAPDVLLFRTVLTGGELVGRRGNGNWTVDPVSGGATSSGQFSEVIIWTVQVPNPVTITLSSLYAAGQNDQSFDLTADKNGIIKLKIANLCSTNPLEWDALTTHLVRSRDEDFKWLYRLLNVMPATLEVPVLAGFQAFGWEDCLGGCEGPNC